MQLFVRTLDGCHLALQCGPEDTVDSLKQSLQARIAIPVEEQLLVHGRRALAGLAPLSALGPDASVQLLLRLRGGKGGFGALLRGQGRDGKITDNFDACRDLSGRRVKQVEAEKKLKEWQATAKQREAQKAAEKAERERARKDELQRQQEMVADLVREEQRRAREHVQDAVLSAVAEGLAKAGNGTATASGTAQANGNASSSGPASSNGAATSGGAAIPSGDGAAAALPAKRKQPEAAAGASVQEGGSKRQRKAAGMLAMLEGSDSDESSDDEDGSS